MGCSTKVLRRETAGLGDRENKVGAGLALHGSSLVRVVQCPWSAHLTCTGYAFQFVLFALLLIMIAVTRRKCHTS